MTNDEYQGLMSQSADQVKDITQKITASDTELSILLSGSRTMRSTEDAQIYNHLYKAFDDIVDDAQRPMQDVQSHRKVIPVGSFELEVTVIHREPRLEKLTGVDVLYNVGDIKILLFQHKKRNREGELTHTAEDRLQMNRIASHCTECSKSKVINRGRFVRHHCASIYVIGDVVSPNRHAVSACEFYKYRREFRRHEGRSNAYNPFSIPAIDSQFVNCLVGRVLDTTRIENLSSQLRESSLNAPHVLIDTILRHSSRGRHGRS